MRTTTHKTNKRTNTIAPQRLAIRPALGTRLQHLRAMEARREEPEMVAMPAPAPIAPAPHGWSVEEAAARYELARAAKAAHAESEARAAEAARAALELVATQSATSAPSAGWQGLTASQLITLALAFGLGCGAMGAGVRWLMEVVSGK